MDEEVDIGDKYLIITIPEPPLPDADVLSGSPPPPPPPVPFTPFPPTAPGALEPIPPPPKGAT